ncbi:hypothetical protein KPL70_025560 [Citrus sinensis]|nr:hypothetical protein KPL70_025560 [Citrus sinensis]
MSRKSLVRGGTGTEISCSPTSTASTRPISCKRHKAILARGREARRPGRRQLARRAPQPENLEPWRNTQDLTEPRQPRFPQNRGVTRKISRLPITQKSESHTVWEKAEDWDSGEAYKTVANEESGRSKGAHISASTSIVLAIAITLALKSKLIECRKGSTVLSNDSILSSQATLRRFSYLELLRATNNFSENNIIGIGGFGSVYGGRLEDGIKIAIKVFHQQCASALKSFEAECEVLKNIRHRNLIKVISSCSNDDFKALVLEYMSNGSLGDWLHSSNYVFNIFQRLNIMIDVASSLEYLHFDHSTAIIHCDLKPSNVLLDENMVAHLSDFGIAKLLRGEDESMMRAKTLATIGYMAPEYGIEGEVSTKSDVYSYGIMLMETFTKKKPTDEIFVGELSLKRWVNDLLPNSLVEVVDKTLLSGEEKLSTAKDQCLLSIFILALECTMESPEKRINAKDIVTGLLKIRDTLSKRIGNLS